ncbi:MAG TPA: methylmalonyl-CoA mutase family protein [Bacteroidales bacterium]|nr:methylmalonyl-CoA mutase family protein [Bacteroidales bacterium]
MAERNKLFSEFPPVSTKEWTDRITADLKGENFAEKLAWHTEEGITVMPFYRQEDLTGRGMAGYLPGEVPFLRGSSANGNCWLIRQDIEAGDFSLANARAADILMKGVDSLGFIIRDPSSISEEAIHTLLKGIHPESVELNFFSDGKAIEILSYFISFVEKNNLRKEPVRGAVEADPLGRLFRSGKLCIPVEDGLNYLAELSRLSLALPSFRTVNINGSWISDAGADVVSELAFSIAMGNEYLSVLTDRGLTSDQAASRIRFSFGTGPNYFFEIAKLRAARLLWSVITAAYNPVNIANTRMEIHSVTGRWNKTEKNPYVNLLRTQTEVMSAVLGGANSVTAEPFDMTFRTADDFSERIARNQQLLLREEAYFDKVADPAGGSWYIEKLTSMIAEKAWEIFAGIEKDGGFIAALNSGLVESGMKKCREARAAGLSGREGLYGKGKGESS